MHFVSPIKTWCSAFRLLSVLVVVVMLQACSGGSGGGASNRTATNGTTTSTGFSYGGPVPANSDIQNFKTAFYDNVVIRCGSCHTSGGVGPTPFVDNDDVNVAWSAAKTVVNLLDPPSSTVVSRVANGHNCWLSSNASCAAAMTSYIERWAAGASQSVSTVTLLPRNSQTLTGLKIAPASYADAVNTLSFDLTADPELMYMLRTYCSGCHTGSSPTPQSPYFASDDPTIAYAALTGKIDLANPANSRFVIRLQNQHNCWSGATGCASDAQEMQDAIARFAADLPVVSVDPGLVISSAQILEKDGIVASGGGRFETDVIAKWEFREGQGSQVADTSGVQPEIPLTALGSFEWVGGWGIRLDDGRVQGSVSGSAKLFDRLAIAGEYSIEAWVAPNNVTQEDAWIFGYAGGPTSRNTLLTQTMYNYDFYNRSTANPQSNGGPATSTDDADEIAQATLQHVVLTYDPINGRKIYVNGVDTGVVDADGPGVLSNWSNAFAVVMGNDFAGASPWQGVIRMIAVHSRALTQAQIQQNYDVGVGQKYYLMFSVSSLVDLPGECHVVDSANVRTDYCYIVFEVSQFDSTGYLFKEPRFVNINPNPTGNNLNFSLRGIYLGINGQLARVGQGFVNIDTTISGNTFTIDDAPLQQPGSIVPLENGPDSDVFFLAFEKIAGAIDTTTHPAPGAFSYSYDDAEQIQIGMRTFDEVNKTFSHITGIATDSSAVSAATGKTVSQTFDSIRRSLPSVGDFQTFMASHQMAVMQLAAAYCDALVEDTSLRAALFNDGTAFDFSASVESVANSTWSNRVIYPLVNRAYATGLNSQPTQAALNTELLDLITNVQDETVELAPDGKSDGLKYCAPSPGTCPAGRTVEVVKAVCTAVLSSAPATMK